MPRFTLTHHSRPLCLVAALALSALSATRGAAQRLPLPDGARTNWLVKEPQEIVGYLVFDTETVAVFFRLVQESLTNVSRHAWARRVVIRLSCGSGTLRLSISDDGRGFDIDETTHKRKNFGLVGMQGAWMLRPFIGDPDVKFRAFRYINGNIFKELGRPIWRMTRDGERPRQQQPRPQPEERRY